MTTELLARPWRARCIRDQRRLGCQFKRCLDVVATLVGGLLLAPFLLVVAILIKLDSPGPIIFKQYRVGLNGRPFELYKFRTMVADAEERRSALTAYNQSTGPLLKIENDPRITRIGRFLRAFSIDEFPQLINVLRGDMSLVGPRPLPVADWDFYRGRPEDARHDVPPGMTGLWQVGGRSSTTGERMLELDLAYVRTWSFLMDLRILLRTFPAVFRRSGAY